MVNHDLFSGWADSGEFECLGYGTDGAYCWL